MLKFRKKPIVIEAVQFTNETKDRVLHDAQAIQMNVTHAWEGEDNRPCLRIPTAEGEMTCSLSDWLIIEPFPTDDRKLYPCKPDIFEMTYEPADLTCSCEAVKWNEFNKVIQCHRCGDVKESLAGCSFQREGIKSI